MNGEVRQRPSPKALPKIAHPRQGKTASGALAVASFQLPRCFATPVHPVGWDGLHRLKQRTFQPRISTAGFPTGHDHRQVLPGSAQGGAAWWNVAAPRESPPARSLPTKSGAQDVERLSRAFLRRLPGNWFRVPSGLNLCHMAGRCSKKRLEKPVAVEAVSQTCTARTSRLTKLDEQRV